jgi:hypothetical protein
MGIEQAGTAPVQNATLTGDADVVATSLLEAIPEILHFPHS